MALKSLYESFLKAPTSTYLSSDASLNYIPTLTTISKAELIAKHLSSQHQSVVKKKVEKILSTVESPSSLCIDVEVTLEFVTGGGAYLPGLDDNFLTDKVVTLPMIHIVYFDANNKIQQIRIYWDQGSLLKQLDVIGSRGRNWPIRDGKDQARLIAAHATTTSSSTSDGHATGHGSAMAPKDPNTAVTPGRSASPSKKHIRDPHASLALFAPEEIEQKKKSHPAVVAPRISAKPAPRDYHDLFVGNETDNTPTKTTPPMKEIQESVTAPKGAGGKNFQPSRLFETESTATSHLPEDPLYKSHPKKYNHFEFGDGDDVVNAQSKGMPIRPRSKGHASQWDFEDFATPDKPRGKVRGQDVRHFGWSDDEGELASSPGKHPRVVHPRRDAEHHFEFQDDGSSGGEKRLGGRPKGSAHNTGLGLYQNNLYDEDGSQPEANKQQPLSTVTNGTNRKKDFGSQFTMTDSSPASSGKAGNENRPVGVDRMKAVKMMDSSWDSYDQSPEQGVTKPKPSGAARKETDRHWGFGDEGDPNTNTNAEKPPVTASKGFWDF